MNHPEVGRSRWDEADRLAALKRYGVLDTTPEAAFDDLANLAARLCEAPMAAVSLVDAERQWFKAEVGLGVSDTPRPTSFCAHAMVSDRPTVVTDACAASDEANGAAALHTMSLFGPQVTLASTAEVLAIAEEPG